MILSEKQIQTIDHIRHQVILELEKSNISDVKKTKIILAAIYKMQEFIHDPKELFKKINGKLNDTLKEILAGAHSSVLCVKRQFAINKHPLTKADQDFLYLVLPKVLNTLKEMKDKVPYYMSLEILFDYLNHNKKLEASLLF